MTVYRASGHEVTRCLSNVCLQPGVLKARVVDSQPGEKTNERADDGEDEEDPELL